MVKSSENIIFKDKDIILEAIEQAIEIFNTLQISQIAKISFKIVLYLPFDDICQFYKYMTLQQSYQNSYPSIQLILMFKESIVCKLFKGSNIIYLPICLLTRKGVGLLPISKSKISTKGLKWNVCKIIFIKLIGKHR